MMIQLFKLFEPEFDFTKCLNSICKKSYIHHLYQWMNYPHNEWCKLPRITKTNYFRCECEVFRLVLCIRDISKNNVVDLKTIIKILKVFDEFGFDVILIEKNDSEGLRINFMYKYYKK